MKQKADKIAPEIQARLESDIWDRKMAQKVIARQKNRTRRQIAALTFLPAAALVLVLAGFLPGLLLQPSIPETNGTVNLQPAEDSESFLAEFSEELLEGDSHVDDILDEMLLASF